MVILKSCQLFDSSLIKKKKQLKSVDKVEKKCYYNHIDNCEKINFNKLNELFTC